MSDTKPEAKQGAEVVEPLLLKEGEAAKFLNISPRTLQGWRVTGGGPTFIKISSRCVRYRWEDLEEWIQERARRSTADLG